VSIICRVLICANITCQLYLFSPLFLYVTSTSLINTTTTTTSTTTSTTTTTTTSTTTTTATTTTTTSTTTTSTTTSTTNTLVYFRESICRVAESAGLKSAIKRKKVFCIPLLYYSLNLI